MRDIPAIVITGGPCSGKSTAMARIPEKLCDYGFSALTVPEAATQLFSSGVKIGEDGIPSMEFQEYILRLQIAHEELYRNMLGRHKNPKKVLLCDRGLMDGKAYMAPDDFATLLKKMGLNEVMLRDAPYVSVIHLVTAAIGAAEFYTTANNTERKESPEEAITLDTRTLEAWVGCPHLRAIDNSTDFEGKMQRLLVSVCRVLGIPAPMEIERSFIIYLPEFSHLPVFSNVVEIEQTYLKPVDEFRRRMRRRSQNGHYTFTETKKKKIKAGTMYEVERNITPEEYSGYMAGERDHSRDIIRKIRHCFAWSNQYFEADVFCEPTYSRMIAALCEDGISFNPSRPIVRLEVELTDENDRLEIPPFIEVIKEVTGDDRYSNSSLALIR
ncbi:MAG: hypothetical protein A2934_05575 [Candidatus Sungbacteria bacterium RIFCSPLOWO2_01_FULL_47_10]|uniref:NadR/Ttd14 AAA domain-containing protein n=1 Tax=Candidatus Sungbacteria bacterium RIFCSPLOWO2_01_FULL_47_10 TaxID=1802276 RepID=A0A1G2L7C0_9BACT|nr:MAG: hypothetical protein A2934_05575 [Candidatus Sungbacteria bacterium RIFCSPLOWO2_01_FULL_47_10]